MRTMVVMPIDALCKHVRTKKGTEDINWSDLQAFALGQVTDEEALTLKTLGLRTFELKANSLVYMPPHYVAWERTCSSPAYGIRYAFCFKMPDLILDGVQCTMSICSDEAGQNKNKEAQTVAHDIIGFQALFNTDEAAEEDKLAAPKAEVSAASTAALADPRAAAAQVAAPQAA